MISATQSTAIQNGNNEQDLHFFNAPSSQTQLPVDSSSSSFPPVFSPPDYQTSKFLSNTGQEISSQSSFSAKPLIKSVNIDNFQNDEATLNKLSQDAETPHHQDTQNIDIELENFTDKSKFSEKRETTNFSPSDWLNKESFFDKWTLPEKQ